jgi:FAD/FMN-containing dehydrogenase
VTTGLQGAIRGHVFERGQPGFEQAAIVFDPQFDSIRPDAVARPADGVDVRDAVRYCRHKGISVRARSGGHSYAGYSTAAHGVVLDLRNVSTISVDPQTGQATIGAGALLIDVYAQLAKSGVTVPGGSCPTVGIAGVTLGGGFGLASRRFGLTVDNVVAMKIVTPDGTLRTVDKHADPDLFWALRGGGGGNFGVVTEFTFTTHPMPPVSTFFEVTWPWSAASTAIEVWQSWAPHADDRVTSTLHVEAGGPDIHTTGQFLGPAADVHGHLAPLLDVSGAMLKPPVQQPYLAMQLFLADCSGLSPDVCKSRAQRVEFRAKSDYVVKPLSADGRAAMVSAAEQPGGDLLCDAYGGAIAQVDGDATAFVHRGPLFCIQYYAPSTTSPAWVDQAWKKMRPYVSGKAYQNYIDHELDGWEAAYYGSALPRLKQVRHQVDPDHYFNFPQAIGR